jgi:hypothetical protein
MKNLSKERGYEDDVATQPPATGIKVKILALTWRPICLHFESLL